MSRSMPHPGAEHGRVLADSQLAASGWLVQDRKDLIWFA